jgi:hypothetical protein
VNERELNIEEANDVTRAWEELARERKIETQNLKGVVAQLESRLEGLTMEKGKLKDLI